MRLFFNLYCLAVFFPFVCVNAQLDTSLNAYQIKKQNHNLNLLDPNSTPEKNFDLKDWKLQTIDSENATIDIPASNLVSGYTSSLFYTDPNDGSLVFRVPSNGGTTDNSSYPRCELRQMGAGANWSLNDPTEHYLYAECKVTQIASEKPNIIIGQIHGSEADSEMIKLRWKGYLPGECIVEARFEKNDITKAEYGVTLASGLSLGDLLQYSITMSNGTIVVTVNGNSASQTYTNDYFGTTDRYYFKAGNYFNYNNTIVQNPIIRYGQTQFYTITLNKTLSNTKIDWPQFEYYPNPVESVLTIKDTNLLTSVEVYNSLGQLVLNSFPNAYSPKIDMNLLTPGIYYLKVFSENKKSLIRVVKK